GVAGRKALFHLFLLIPPIHGQGRGHGKMAPAVVCSPAAPHNLRSTPQAAYRAEIFRDIFQKRSPIHQGLAALFGSSHKKFPDALHP
ncbi:hypothetical protein, partial [Allofournierella massiliensis]|uniref:hypothetical protein n=1 Tax=Allofournierella massiliensis TaxID=1650663 RepID=UPI0024B09537